MTDDRHDDGLVHSHGWATEPPRPVQALPIAAKPNTTRTTDL